MFCAQSAESSHFHPKYQDDFIKISLETTLSSMFKKHFPYLSPCLCLPAIKVKEHSIERLSLLLQQQQGWPPLSLSLGLTRSGNFQPWTLSVSEFPFKDFEKIFWEMIK